jgi:hypothetical protein
MNEDVNGLAESPSEEFVFSSITFIGVFDRRNTLCVIQSFLKWILLYFFTIILAKVIDFFSECIKGILFNDCLNSFLFFLFLFVLLLFLCLFLNFCLSLVLLNLMHILFQVFNSPTSSFSIFLIVVDVIVELDQLSILSKSPFPQAVSMEVILVSLEINKMLGDKLEVTKTSLEVSLLQERFSGFDDVPMVLKFVKTCLISHEKSKNSFAQFWLFTAHEILNTYIVHVTISKVSLSCLIDGFE